MRNRIASVAAFAALALGLLATLASGPATATDEMATTTGLACTACHDKPGSKLLTGKGKYYELMGSLEGYDQLHAAFKDCMACHIAKPGSKKLTAEGRKFAALVEDMAGLRAWLATEHPTAPQAPNKP